MNVDLYAALWSLPGSQRFLNRVIKALENGKSLWVLFPSPMMLQPFEKALLDLLKNEYFDIIDLQGYDTYAEMEILAGVFPHLETEINTEKWPLERIARESGGPTYILIRNFELLNANSRQRWAQTVNDWGSVARRYAVNHSLCVFTTAEAISGLEELLVEDVRLQVEYWYATLSTSELGLLCRLVDEQTSLRAIWRQYLLPSLSSEDMELMQYLWDAVFDPVDELTNALRNFAAERGWKPEEKELVINGWRPCPPLVKPVLRSQSMNLWRKGWLTYLPENGEELHTALLAMLDKNSEIQHRIWRGQAALLLPMIDSIRVLICEHLITDYGEGWPRMAGCKDVDSYVELGVLENILRNTPQFRREKQQWLEVVMQARSLRNELAHYTPVVFDEFARFWKQSTKVHQQLRRFI